LQIIPLFEEEWLIQGAILGVTYMYNSLALRKAGGNTCMQRFDFGTCIRKHTTTAYADSFLKALNAKESFHAHQVSMLYALLMLYVLVQKAPHLRYKILAARNQAS